MTAGGRGAWVRGVGRGLLAASALAGLLLALECSCGGRERVADGVALAALHSPTQCERVRALPVYADLGPGAHHLRLPGLASTWRVRLDPQSGRVHEIELALAQPLLVYGGPRAEQGAPRVAVTFDDGPSPAYTPQVLELLERYHARATFFVLGCCAVGHPDLVRRTAAAGHEIGIHSWSHPQYPRLSDAAIAADLARCRALLQPLVDQPIRWMRPPYGAHNARVDAAINAAGLRVAMWSVDPRDWSRPGAAVVAARVLGQVRDGSVVLLHDGGGDRSGTVAALRTILAELQRRGFRLVTMSQLVGDEPEEQGMVLTIADQQFRLEGGLEDVRVVVNGAPVALPTPPLRTRGQFLLPARPVLSALGAACAWHPESLTLEVDAPRGHFLVRLNSQRMVVDGREVFVQVPAVLYRDQALLPAWMIANACRATVEFDPATRTVQFTTIGGLQAHPAGEGEGCLIARRGLDGMSISGQPCQPWTL